MPEIDSCRTCIYLEEKSEKHFCKITTEEVDTLDEDNECCDYWFNDRLYVGAIELLKELAFYDPEDDNRTEQAKKVQEFLMKTEARSWLLKERESNLVFTQTWLSTYPVPVHRRKPRGNEHCVRDCEKQGPCKSCTEWKGEVEADSEGVDAVGKGGQDGQRTDT